MAQHALALEWLSRRRVGVQLSDEALEERRRRWVALRRAGQTVRSITDAEGVGHQVVSKLTAGYGPFPSEETVQAWAQQRRDGVSPAEIAAASGAAEGTVRSRTAPLGPFPYGRPRLPSTIETVRSISRRLGLSRVTVGKWRDKGYLPPADFTTAAGRSVWLPSTIDAWLATAEGMETCPECGARCRSVSRHGAHVHR